MVSYETELSGWKVGRGFETDGAGRREVIAGSVREEADWTGSEDG